MQDPADTKDCTYTHIYYTYLYVQQCLDFAHTNCTSIIHLFTAFAFSLFFVIGVLCAWFLSRLFTIQCQLCIAVLLLKNRTRTYEDASVCNRFRSALHCSFDMYVLQAAATWPWSPFTTSCIVPGHLSTDCGQAYVLCIPGSSSFMRLPASIIITIKCNVHIAIPPHNRFDSRPLKVNDGGDAVMCSIRHSPLLTWTDS